MLGEWAPVCLRPQPSPRPLGGAAFPQSLAVSQPSGRDLELGKEPAEFSFVANAYAHITCIPVHTHRPVARQAMAPWVECVLIQRCVLSDRMSRSEIAPIP